MLQKLIVNKKSTREPHATRATTAMKITKAI